MMSNPDVKRTTAPRDRDLASALAHLVLFAISFLLAFALSYDFIDAERWFTMQFMMVLPVVLAVKYAVFSITQQHQRSWRYVGYRDVASTALATAIANLVLFSIAMLFKYGAPDRSIAGIFQFPISVWVIDWLLSNALVIWARLGIRYFFEAGRRSGLTGKREFIVGAGDAGETLLREIRRMAVDKHQIVGMLDDDVKKLGARIHGVPVLGAVDQIKHLCAVHDIEQVLIAIPSASPKRIREIVQLCEGANVGFRIVPGLTELVEGSMTIESQLRAVNLEDLLYREPVVLDREMIGEHLRGKVVLVTGAGGSIGSELCRQIMPYGPERLILVEQSENNLFDIDRELREVWGDSRVVPYLADICDTSRMTALFDMHRPEIVCHAAAHKHVPMLEAHPGEGIKNNVVGTKALADLAAEHGVARFVYISTDKAVNPTSIMGCTKRIAESYVQGLSERCDTQFITVRFGNVLGSRGSVVPIFMEQIAKGGPVTITHPEITRYFMTIPEAAQLVLQAGVIGKGGEIFLLEMGEPVKIVDLAKNLITLSGLTPEVDIDIKFTGLRPGEKLFEELYIDGEGLSPTAHPSIRVWQKRSEDWDALVRALPELVALADTADVDEIKRNLARLVPEYQLDYVPAPVPDASTPQALPV